MVCRRAGSLAAIASVLALAPMAVEAELLVYEPFDYSPGTVMDGLPATGFNLAGGFSTDVTPGFELVSASPGLDHGNLTGGLPAVAGNRVTQAVSTTPGDATVDVDQDVLIGEGEAIYFSALFTLDDSVNGNHRASVTLVDDVTDGSITFGEATVGSRAVRVSAQTPATGGDTVAAGADGSFENGQTLWLIGRYFNSGAPEGDTLELVGYDTAVAQPVAPTFDLLDPNTQFAYMLDEVDIDLARVTSIRFTIRGAANNHIDELRIGDTYADVALPEPAAGAALLAISLFCVRRVRRRP